MNYKYLTISNQGKSLHKVRGSKHFGYAIHVTSEEDIEEALEEIRKEHHSARHVAYAWRLGAEKDRTRANDDGEPSNSAGKPILGQIEKYDLTNVLVAVVRYFGGTKLGVGGLIDAYRTAGALAIEDAKTVTKQLLARFKIKFGYERMSEVMLALRTHDWEVISQDFQEDCVVKIGVVPEKKEDVTVSFRAFADIQVDFLGIA